MKKIITIILFIICFPLFSGDLDDFERSVRNEDKGSSSSSGDGCTDALCDVGCALCGEGCLEMAAPLIDIIIDAGAITTDRIKGDHNSRKRSNGGFTIPFLRLDSNVSYINKNLYSINNRVEAGYGAFAGVIDVNIYNEKDPKDQLIHSDILFLYRIATSNRFEIDFSAGLSYMGGNSETFGFKSGIPIRISPADFIGFEIRPAIIYTENPIADLDISAYLGYRYLGLTIGYKFLGTPDSYLSGFYAGVRYIL